MISQNKTKRQIIIDMLDNNVSKENILLYCKKKGLKNEIAETIDIFLKYSIKVSCSKLFISESTLKYRINKFIQSNK